MTDPDVKTATFTFCEAAAKYGRALEAGDHKSATKAARQGRAARDVIKAHGRAAIQLLIETLRDPDPWIRYAAATSLLDTDAGQAIPILEELQSYSGSIGAAAFTALRMWNTRPNPEVNTI